MLVETTARQHRRTELVVTVTWLGPEALALVIGEVDVFSVPVLASRLDEVVARGARRVTVDASQLSFIDSAGMAVLATTTSTLRSQGGDLVILDGRPRLLRILRLLGLDEQMSFVTAFPAA